MGNKILIADDDSRINELLQEIFTTEGYEVIAAYDGEEAIRCLEEDADIALLVLDVMMPKLDGWDVLEYVRQQFDVKILMLTALTDEADEVRGLRGGADDYVAKPFRRAALLERAKRLIQERQLHQEACLSCGDLRVSRTECKVYRKEEELKLTLKEYQLLLLLMQNRKMVLSRAVILDKIWGMDYEGNDRTVDTHIKMLRQSIGEYGNKIRTIRGMGYSFEGEVEEC